MNPFYPRLDCLPTPQQSIWPDLRQVPRVFVLYGGTAIALQLGHRQSLDFDFFSSEPVIPEKLLETIPFLAHAKILQNERQTLTVAVQRQGIVKVSFFGGLGLGRVKEPLETNDGTLRVASLLDLAGTKAAVIQKRAEVKDYLDIIALIDHGISLAEALGAAQALYPEQYNPMITLKALTYFTDGNLHTLTQPQRETLINAASQITEIPEIRRISTAIHA
jgi:hypothetical protein